jgi:hypothetical protein
MQKALPKLPDGWWWKVELVRGTAGKPMKVSLMESIKPGSRSLSRCLIWGRALSTVKSIAEVAGQLHVQVADYEKLEGDYGL